MPYRGAWLGVAMMVALTVHAFWFYYFVPIASQPFYSHFHGATGFAWMALVATQSWLVDHRNIALHRRLGRAMLVIVPLFAAGGLLVIMQLQRRTNEFQLVMGNRLALVESIGVGTTLLMCFLALRHRRTPALHGGFLLMSLLPLWYAIGTRLPFIIDNMPGDGLLPTFSRATDVSMAMMMACAGLGWWRQPRFALPFRLSLLATAAEWAAFYLAPDIPGWPALAGLYGTAPAPVIAAAGLGAGTVAVWTGWQAGTRPVSRPPPAS